MDWDRNSLIETIQSSGFKTCMVISGGGSGTVHEMLSHAGASRFILEIQIPYSQQALFDFLGAEVDSACSKETAVAMAERAFERAVVFTRSDEVDVPVLGIACSAALQTNRERRGEDRAYIAIKAQHHEVVRKVEFAHTSRAEQDAQLSRALLESMAEFLRELTQ